jgi:hypothetical protein
MYPVLFERVKVIDASIDRAARGLDGHVVGIDPRSPHVFVYLEATSEVRRFPVEDLARQAIDTYAASEWASEAIIAEQRRNPPSKIVEVVGGAIPLIRKRPEMYFGTSEPRARHLSTYVVDDLFDADANHFTVNTSDRLTIIVSATDWMQGAGRSVSDLFKGFVPAKRVNSIRAEVLIAACCDEFGTGGPSGDYVSGLSASDLPGEALSAMPPLGRWLAFRMKRA